MRVLVACERSGIVRTAFRDKGHDAWSCDLEPADDGSEYHLQEDVLDILHNNWDLMIAHPPCTYLASCGARWQSHDRRVNQELAVDFFLTIADDPIEQIAIENPVGIMSTRYRRPDQIIHPYHFGHPVSKATCLWLKNLPPLFHTNVVEPEVVTFESGRRMSKWYADSFGLRPAERQRYRSQTFDGIAWAMAEQWG